MTQFCTRCVMPDTRPGIKFNEEGVCHPCLAAEKAQSTDWQARAHELAMVCEYHSFFLAHAPYDCIVPVSGGKDSHVQVATLKAHNMRPLLVSVGDWFTHTEAGERNFRNLCEEFDCDSFLWRQSPANQRHMVVKAFYDLGSPTWPIDAAIYTVPLRVAKQVGVSLVVYGENIAYTYGGPGAEETPSARRQHGNDVVKAEGLKYLDPRSWLNTPDQTGLESVYLSYYIPWDGRNNYERAKRMGFRNCSSEWYREGCVEDYDQIDSFGYMVHPWLKYPKFGHARATDVASAWVRGGHITRNEAVELVRENDAHLDPQALDDFLSFTGISTPAFWARVDDLYNLELFERVRETWKLKEVVR